MNLLHPSRRGRQLRIAAAVTAFLLGVAVLFFDGGGGTGTGSPLRTLSNEVEQQTEEPEPPESLSEESAEVVPPEEEDIEEKLKDLRVLLYITTHVSDQHRRALSLLWPDLLERSALLRHADVLFYVDEKKTSELSKVLYRPRDPNTGNRPTRLFANQTVRVRSGVNAGYHAGAVAAIRHGVHLRWFDSYDWIIRVNPDVLILKDDWIVRRMVDDNIDGIFVDCMGDKRHEFDFLIQTDFTMWRPGAVPPVNGVSMVDGNPHASNAEHFMTHALRPIVQSGRYELLNDNEPRPGAKCCRVRGEKSSVVHQHSFVEGMLSCLQEERGSKGQRQRGGDDGAGGGSSDSCWERVKPTSSCF